MPFVKVETNFKIDPAYRPVFLRGLSGTASKMLGKPEGYVMVVLEAGKDMIRGGSDEPMAYLTVNSIGLDSGNCPEYSRVLCGFMEEELGISPERTYISFGNIDGKMYGWNNSTF